MTCDVRNIATVCGKKNWGQIGEQLKKSGKFQCFSAQFASYFHSIITEVLIINR
jgi:hypothetical protein